MLTHPNTKPVLSKFDARSLKRPLKVFQLPRAHICRVPMALHAAEDRLRNTRSLGYRLSLPRMGPSLNGLGLLGAEVREVRLTQAATAHEGQGRADKAARLEAPEP